MFLHFRIINRIFSRLDVFIDDDFFSFFTVDCSFFFVRFVSCLSFFSHCLLSFACLDGLFYLICLSLPLITHFLYFFDVFLYALRVACLFFALLAGFCTAWRLVLRNMSFFTVDCSFFCTL